MKWCFFHIIRDFVEYDKHCFIFCVPMAARVSQKVGQKEVPDNYLLMHAMGPNVAGVIGSAVAAGLLLAVFGG